MTNDEAGEITPRMLLQHMQAMEATLLGRIDGLDERLAEHIDRGMDGLRVDFVRLECKLDALIVRVDSINARLGAVEDEHAASR